MTAPAIVPDVRRIAVLRANGLGDFVAALPALEALRAAYPDAEIVLLGRAWHRELLAARPSPVDRVEALPQPFVGDEAGPEPDAADREGALRGLRERGWDIALQMHGGGRHSNPIVRALGARVTAGARTPDAVDLDRVVPYVYWQNEVLRNLEIASLVGARPVTLEPRLAVVPADKAAGAAALGPVSDGSKPLAVLNPGATDPRRRWPAGSFGSLGRRLRQRGLRVAITGGREDVELAAEVADALGAEAVSLAGRTDLSALIGVLATAAIVISNDTGPLHVAGAVGSPTVGIYWCGNLINAGPAFRAGHRPILAWRLQCPRCGADCMRAGCDHRDSFVADVEVGEVLDAALDLLDLEPDHARRAGDSRDPADDATGETVGPRHTGRRRRAAATGAG